MVVALAPRGGGKKKPRAGFSQGAAGHSHQHPVETRARSMHTSANGEWGKRDDLLALADLTLAEYLRYLAGYGGAILEEDGLLLFAGAHRQPNPYRNGLLRLDTRLDAEEA